MEEALSARLTILETRLSAAEAEAREQPGAAGASSAEASGMLLEYQKQMLARLLAVREALVSGGGDIAYVVKEREALKEENARLKKEAERLNYRIAHLVKHVP